MAFNAANLTKWSPNNVTGPAFYGYLTADTTATVSVATYFTPFAHSNSQALLQHPFSVGDTIQATCSDGLVQINIDAIDPISSSPEAVTIVIGPNSVNTAAIQALAVTTAKIDNLAVTTAKIDNQAVTAGKIANATITTTQIAAAAAIVGTQLAAGANIAGTQLAAAAAIAGTQLAANTIDSSRLALNTIQYVKVPMSAAQWNGMYAAPFLLIAAPAAGLMIVVKQAILSMTFVSANYANGGAIALQLDSTVHGAGVLSTATLAAATVNAYAASSAVAVAGALASGASASKTAKGLYISNDTAAFDTGDSTWQVHVWYEIVTL